MEQKLVKEEKELTTNEAIALGMLFGGTAMSIITVIWLSQHFYKHHTKAVVKVLEDVSFQIQHSHISGEARDASIILMLRDIQKALKISPTVDSTLPDDEALKLIRDIGEYIAKSVNNK